LTNVQPIAFPVIEDVTTLWRSLVNDTFTGLQGTQGRIATDNAAFTLPFLNSAIRTVFRKLRNEGVTFPTIDGWILNAVPPVVKADPSVFVSIGYDGTNNGTTTSAKPNLPGDCYQIYEVRQRVTGSNLPFSLVEQAQSGLQSGYQNNWVGQWEVRQFRLFLNGSLQAQDLMLRYQQFQPPLNTPAIDFPSTPIYIIDSTDALAYLMAADYGGARGASDNLIKRVEAKADDAISDMANEYIRRSQTINYQRQSYQGGGSNNTGNTSLGSTGVVS
jgi:hypothetical protein